MFAAGIGTIFARGSLRSSMVVMTSRWSRTYSASGTVEALLRDSAD